MDKVLVIGNGSIGKRHSKNLLQLGFSPVVLTNYPDSNTGVVKYISSLNSVNDVDFAIVATPTAQHFDSVEKILRLTTCKKILIEKPISNTFNGATKIKKLAEQNNAEIFVAYNMRFLKVFDIVKDLIMHNMSDIKLVHIVAGQYLPEWRPNKDYRTSYSAHRNLGGGVDLDLSHEIDYMNWCFHRPKNIKICIREKISKLDIDSPDYFKGLYEYNNFIVDVELDYFRNKERTLKILSENKELLFIDFINKTISVDGKKREEKELFDFDGSYLEELKEFLGLSKTKKLTTLEESMSVLTLLMLEGK